MKSRRERLLSGNTRSRLLITLGLAVVLPALEAPSRVTPDPESVRRAVQAPLREEGCFTDHCGCAFARHYAGPFPQELPLTSIYSRGDGVVKWDSCVVPYAQCVEVSGSHIGLAFNRKAYRAVAAALADCA